MSKYNKYILMWNNKPVIFNKHLYELLETTESAFNKAFSRHCEETPDMCEIVAKEDRAKLYAQNPNSTVVNDIKSSKMLRLWYAEGLRVLSRVRIRGGKPISGNQQVLQELIAMLEDEEVSLNTEQPQYIAQISNQQPPQEVTQSLPVPTHKPQQGINTSYDNPSIIQEEIPFIGFNPNKLFHANKLENPSTEPIDGEVVDNKIDDETFEENTHNQSNYDYSDRTPIEAALEVDENGMTTAKKLYTFLGLHLAHYARWCETNIVNNPWAVAGNDYQLLTINGESINASADTNAGSNKSIDYMLKSDFASKLAMASGSKRGEEVRNYFLLMEKISVEVNKRLQAQNNALSKMDAIVVRKAELEVQSMELDIRAKQRAIEREDELAEESKGVIRAEKTVALIRGLDDVERFPDDAYHAMVKAILSPEGIDIEGPTTLQDATSGVWHRYADGTPVLCAAPWSFANVLHIFTNTNGLATRAVGVIRTHISKAEKGKDYWVHPLYKTDGHGKGRMLDDNYFYTVDFLNQVQAKLIDMFWNDKTNMHVEAKGSYKDMFHIQSKRLDSGEKSRTDCYVRFGITLTSHYYFGLRNIKDDLLAMYPLPQEPFQDMYEVRIAKSRNEVQGIQP